MFELKIIVNCGPCERYIEACLNSLKAQSYTRWSAVVSVDPSDDRTYRLAAAACRHDSRFDLVHNDEPQFAMRNLLQGIARSEADPEDVIVILDGDDWLRLRHALETIAVTYRDSGCWMTYGSWVSNVPGLPGLWPAYPAGTTDFRQFRWLATAIRTWKKWLWDLVEDRDFRDDRGAYFRVAEDLAVMFPMLEMSGTERARHIGEPLMLYNNANPAGTARIRRDELRRNSELIRNRRPYARLDGPDARRA